jgi:hypothetical protein
MSGSAYLAASPTMASTLKLLAGSSSSFYSLPPPAPMRFAIVGIT